MLGGDETQNTRETNLQFSISHDCIPVDDFCECVLHKGSPSNGEVEGPRDHTRLEPRVHTLFPHPRRHYRLSRTPPTIVRPPATQLLAVRQGSCLPQAATSERRPKVPDVPAPSPEGCGRKRLEALQSA